MKADKKKEICFFGDLIMRLNRIFRVMGIFRVPFLLYRYLWFIIGVMEDNSFRLFPVI